MSARLSTSRGSSSPAAAPPPKSSWAAPPLRFRIPGPPTVQTCRIGKLGQAPLTLRRCPQFCCPSPWRSMLNGWPRPWRTTCISTRSRRRPFRPSTGICFRRAEFWRGAIVVMVIVGKFASRTRAMPTKNLTRSSMRSETTSSCRTSTMTRRWLAENFGIFKYVAPTPETEDSDNVVEPPPELRRELYRTHRNLGHPDDQTFCRALRHSGVKVDILKRVKKKFECPICQRRKKPGTHRPAHLSRQMEFNAVVGVDLVFVQRYVIVNCLCWGTGYQQAIIVETKESNNVAKAVLGGWHKFFGPPAMVVVDQGKEFASRTFSEAIGEWGTVVHFIDVRSPWQNSRTERAGASLKSVINKILDERTACSPEEFGLAVDAAVWCRNQYYDRSGFSPFQRVFGKSMRTPYALLSDDAMDRDMVNHVHSDATRQAQAVRNKALQAWAETQDEMAIHRAVSTRTRTTDLKELANGDTVYVWRHTVDYVGWVGPGVVVNQADNGRSLWVSLRGYLIKASREQVRSATNEESLGAELVKVLSSELLEKLENGELRNFRDIREEGGPEVVHPMEEDPDASLEIPLEERAPQPPDAEDERMEEEAPSTTEPPTLESRRPSTTEPSTF